ncbi:DNA helicase MCM8-like [Aphidius gifuensis]|uniref:DNA helicase MCM8-like n=1 Tax=Aphidius gifuensis TaxID=684658 RepID=UPI001CDD332A|nr:DNA helicase MCM8-like [Aphidius gifuensis]
MNRRFWKKKGGKKNNDSNNKKTNIKPPDNNNDGSGGDDDDDNGIGNDNLNVMNINNADDSPEPDNPTLDVYKIKKKTDDPYYSIHLYFDKKDFKNKDLLEKVETSLNFIKRNLDVAEVSLHGGPSFNISIDRFNKDEEFINEWETFNDDLINKPRETLNCLGLALHQVLAEKPMDNDPLSIDNTNLPMIRVKIINLKQIIPLRDIKLTFYGKLISTRGCVVRVGRTRHIHNWIPFTCIKCTNWQIEKQPDGIYTLPNKCNVCGGGKFKPRCDSRYVKTTPFQIIKLQEHFNSKQDDRGKMPRILEVELFDDLVEICMPGDDITVVGMIKVRGTDDGILPKSVISSSNSMYMEAVSIVNNKNKSKGTTEVGIDLNIHDYFAIKKVHDSQDVFTLLVHSLCPAIYGHELVKAGLLLSLIGGSSKHESLRDDIHVLIVGDPGLGKSQMLQACSRVAVKGVYVCGNSSTSSGLTVTLTKENGTNDFALEPGALVLADKGSCIIDEFDKMPTQHQALLEAMEQSRVSVAKSGIICSLPARTSILAAANPIGGRYDRSKSVTENLNLSQPLLSRFDLIYLLLDQPNEQLDTLLCSHVMNAHTGFKRTRAMRDADDNDNDQMSTAASTSNELTNLKERLTGVIDQEIVPQPMLRKYIAYARQYVKPKLSIEAAKLLQDYYLSLREMNNIFGSLPIFHRQLEALIRLTEARAKVELRTIATEDDAREIIEIFKFTISSVPPQSLPEIRRTNDTGKITANKVSAFVVFLREQIAGDDNKLFTDIELKDIADAGGIVIKNFSLFINKLNEEGILIKRPNGYKFIGM